MEEELLHYFTTQRNATLPHHNFFDLQTAVVQSAFQQASHYLIHYYHQRFLPSLSLNEMTIGLEQKLTVQNFSVTIDRLTKKEDTFIIYDYKTNKKLTEEEQQFHREQLYLYARAVQENYGIYFSHLECCLEYLAL
jgi:ATP-dependent exoDNAse (exonuclease V) beta subunit